MEFFDWIRIFTGILLVSLGLLSFTVKVTENAVKKEPVVYFIEILMVILGLLLVFAVYIGL